MSSTLANIIEMHLWIALTIVLKVVSQINSQVCQTESCPVEETTMICAFDTNKKSYKMFSSKCAMDQFAKCFNNDFIRTPYKFCIKEHFASSRRLYGESCPVFCPSHYKPVCGASKYRGYVYRTFNNGCYLDMINCRGDEDVTGYVEVPLHFCQRHLMKNIYKEQVVMSNKYDYADYN